MADEPKLLLLEDPEAFMAIVQNDDPEQRINSLHTLDDMVVCEVIRRGVFNYQHELNDLVGFYSEIFMQAPVERRQEIYDYVKMIVPQLGGQTAGAFIPLARKAFSLKSPHHSQLFLDVLISSIGNALGKSAHLILA